MTKALLIIDMINDFAHKEGKLFVPSSRKIIPNILSLTDKADKRGVIVLYPCDSHREHDREVKLFGLHAKEDSWESKLIQELYKDSRYFDTGIIKKHFYSAFSNSSLSELLNFLRIRTLILTGVCTDICIAHTCYDAYTRGYKLIVVSDATGTFTDKKHKESLDFIKQCYGAKIVKSRDVFSEEI